MSAIRPGKEKMPEAPPSGCAAASPIILDDRERASGLAEAIRRICGVEPRVERLHLGDVLVAGRILIERKAVADFAASVVDGRLFRQAAGLRAEPFQPLLILEGEMTEEARWRLDPGAIRGAILSVSLDYRVPVLRSRSVDDTARWIQVMLLRREKQMDLPDWRGVTPDGRRRPRGEVATRPRRRVPSPEAARRNQGIELLSTIEGVGRTKAELLLKEFKSVGMVLAASPSDLARVPGIGKLLAAKIHGVLH